LRGSALPRATQPQVAEAWLAMVRHAKPSDRADEVYGGRSFSLAKGVARKFDADLAIVSAGLGYVKAETRVPSYDFTLARGNGNALCSHVLGGIDVQRWWLAMLRGPFSSSPSKDFAFRELVLVCLSRAYAPFVAPELSSIPTERLRIFGTSLHGALPEDLKACVLPYDDRLGSLGFTGTRSDFAQRALAHYATHVHNGGSLADDRASVVTIMKGGHFPMPTKVHASVDDDAIRIWIKKLMPIVGARRTPMLQHLRHVEGIACEQKRFARLFAETIERA
jgi:hypothetical protein